MRVAFIFILLFSLLWAEEPSVFELQSSVTKKEIQDIKGKVESQSDKIFELENRIKQLEISLDGIKSMYEGLSADIKKIYNKTISNDNDSNEENFTSSLSKNEITILQEQISSNAANIQVLTDSLKNISASIEQIRTILNDEVKSNNNDATKQTDTKKDSTQDNKNQSVAGFDKDTTKRDDIFKEARRLTYAKKFDDAIARYNWFIEIDYKKAESNYMLGNIAYEQNRYKDAIFYYKESAVLDDKADYMPRLLLNSANSFKVLQEIENAKKFYNSLISLFPNSSEAKEASKQLKKLK